MIQSSLASDDLSPTLKDVVLSTWQALLRPRRAVAILVVMGPVLLLQARYSADQHALFVGLLLCAAFVALAPLSFRLLMRHGSEPFVAALGLAAYAFFGAAVVFITGKLLPTLLHMPPTFLTNRPTLVACLALYWVGGWGLGRDIDLEARYLREKSRAEVLAREAEHAQLLALKSHLDPHFLFNTLNAIAEWCRTDGVVAERAVLELSELLRDVMGGIHQTLWPLSREIALTRRLFELHRIRDPERFLAEVDYDPRLGELQVPPMMLLPLAENAMKHGPEAGHRGHVRLSVQHTDVGVVIEISNPGPFRGPRAGGAGLGIVEKRLRLSFGAAATFAVVGDGTTTKATIVLAHPLTQRLCANASSTIEAKASANKARS